MQFSHTYFRAKAKSHLVQCPRKAKRLAAARRTRLVTVSAVDNLEKRRRMPGKQAISSWTLKITASRNVRSPESPSQF